MKIYHTYMAVVFAAALCPAQEGDSIPMRAVDMPIFTRPATKAEILSTTAKDLGFHPTRIGDAKRTINVLEMAQLSHNELIRKYEAIAEFLPSQKKTISEVVATIREAIRITDEELARQREIVEELK